MKCIYKNFNLFLIFLIIMIFKDSVYGLMKDNIPAIQDKIQEAETNYYKEEYYELLKISGIDLCDNYSYVLSKVLYHNIYDFYNELTILKGSKDNIHKGDAVINESGLIGVIKKVSNNNSIVTLITSKNSEISVAVNNSYGILKYIDNKLVITSINNYEDIEIGDIVYTSGIGFLPKGLKIGEITKVTHNTMGVEKKVVVTSYVDFDNLNYIAVLNGD